MLFALAPKGAWRGAKMLGFRNTAITILAVLVSEPVSVIPTSIAIGLSIICMAIIGFALHQDRQ